MRRALTFLSAAGLVLLISLSLGIFLFDRQLVVFKKVLPEKVTIFTNSADLGQCLKYSLLSLPAVALAVLLPRIFRSRKSGGGLARSLTEQALTLAPLLVLVFARFFYGKYLKVIVYLPLYPLLLIAAATAVIYLNASLHFGFRIFKKRPRSSLPGPSGGGEAKKLAVLLAPLALLLAHILSLSPFFQRYSSLMIFTGDEPKYLRMAHSLASDGDLDVTDDFVGDEVEVQWRLQKARASGERAIGHFSIVGRDGGIYHLHMPGLSLLMQPGFLLDLAVFQRDIPNTQAIMFLPAKMIFTRLWLLLLAMVLFFLAARFFYLMFRSPVILALLLLAMMFATKIPYFMFQVYPESAAGLFLLLGLNAVFFPFRRKGWNALSLVAAVGFLPWLHQRFIPLAAGLYVLFLFHEILERKDWRGVLAVSLALAAVGLGYLYFFYAITGSPLPWSMYSLWGTSYTRAAILPSGFFGYIFDTGSGLLSLFPVFLFVLTGVYWGIRLDRRRALMLLAFILPYFGLISITPWHGLGWETTRMSLVLFPVFLVFLGYTIRALASRSSWAHLAFYLAALAFVLWNRSHRLWDISLGNVLILPHQVWYIIQCFFVLLGFYLTLRALELWTEKKLGPLPLARLRGGLGDGAMKLKAAFRSPALWKSLLVLGLALPAVYIPVFLRNWDDPTMAKSYFDALNKVGRSNDIVLHRKSYPSTGRGKSDTKFIDIFKWTVPIELSPGKQRTTVRLGSRLMSDGCPPGCYKVDLEFYDSPPELDLLSLDFMRETREMPLDPCPGKSLISTIYLVFEDMPISPEFVIRHNARLSRPVRGQLVFFPIPSLVFDKRLLVRLSEGLYPDPIRSSGLFAYLGLVANSRKDNARFSFQLSFPPGAGAGDGAAALPPASFPVKFRNRGRHRFDIRLDFPAGRRSGGGSVAFFALDGHGKRMDVRSIWLPCRGDAWLVPLLP